jgi:hypothetical protein
MLLGEIYFSMNHLERLLKMKSAIRMFALLVAFAGLASASLSSNVNQVHPAQMSSAVSGPVPMGTMPGPVPCQATNSCLAPAK